MPGTPQSSPICTHERRPGTTVCLRCRHAARLEARLKLQRLLLRGTAVGIVVATFIAAGALGATAIRNKVVDDAANRAAKMTESSRPHTERASEPASDSTSVRPAAAVVSPPAAPATRPAATIPTATRASAPLSSAALHPVIPMGPSSLPDSVTALRGDSDVVVSFDLMMVRTRRAEKFEQFVRTTLPLIYGRAAGDALSKIPNGGLAAQGELLEELPTKGLHIPGAGWTIRLFPETRPGHDGPLVVRYRVSVAPGGD